MEAQNYQALVAARDNEQVLESPIEDLVARNEQDLSNAFFKRVAQSDLYAKKWRKAQVRLREIEGRQGLQSLPLLHSRDLEAMNASGKSIKAALLARPRTWLISRGAQGQQKWLPVTERDVANWFLRMRRLFDQIGRAETHTLALAINEPMPRTSNAIPYLWERADYLTGPRQIEWIIAAMQMLPRVHWDRFITKKPPHWLISSVEDALKLGETLASEPAAERHPAFANLQTGFFWGSALDGPHGRRQELIEAFGLQTAYNLYFSAECREMYFECHQHDGLHLWMDGPVHEILPQGSQQALFVDQAPVGMRGEYVVTTFNEALPLLRYRTGDQIEIVSTQPCTCGISHPRVLFNGRLPVSDDQRLSNKTVSATTHPLR